MKKRITSILLTLALFGYLIFLGRSDYLIEWLAHNNFCYVWAVIVVLWAFHQDICAKWLTAGSILAVFPAQIMENIKFMRFANDNPAAHSFYWGVPTWIVLVIFSLIIGCTLQYRKWRKDHPKPAQPTDPAENSEI